tara:strand:+ start:1659 stop:2087 length:429 start_codon:yes stop_codon:yes gene_type:complete
LARDKQLQFWLSLPTLLCLVIVGSIPFAFPILANYEGQWFPVVENVEVQETLINEEGAFINVRFDKVRSCEFIGISWYDDFGQRLIINFAPNEAELPVSRPVGDDQFTGPWQLVGLTSLEGSRAIVSHRCHPFWTTFTNFYP